MKTLTDIRSTFIDYFAKNDHEVVASSPLVPQNDPSLMFTNAGMVQFKDVFTGKENRDYVRATSAQKCVRAGGKHNDLDNVGHTARHHTFFEMMGNFSFGDYFKEQAIVFAWELITKEFGLKPDNLLITVHSSDEEAAALWRKIAGFSDSKIIRIPTSDNFWQMGDTGPCGPCTEIFIDQGEDVQGGIPGSADEDGDRFLEFWNLVFMQFDKQADGTRNDLPKPCVDTGMGLERMAAILQGVKSNYDTDLMRALTGAVSDLTGKKLGVSHRVIADHLRASSFLIADGVMPSNEGRGYVLRRIMRRAMRHANMLGANEPLMHRLFPELEAQMGAAYPELSRASALIKQTLKGEEERFGKTLERGLRILEDKTKDLRKGEMLDGKVAFTLYDTYGFPLDLVADALKSKGLRVDAAGFEEEMTQQKQRARASWSGSGDTGTDKIWYDISEEFGKTDFTGYEGTKGQGRILAIVSDSERLDKIEEGGEGLVILDTTPFYAESGGQTGDVGCMSNAATKTSVTATIKPLPTLHAHRVKVEEGSLNVGDTLNLNVDGKARSKIAANHSATHLLHAALREILGEHVTQKGSLVNERRLRFDIAHPIALTAQQIKEVEELVGEKIRENSKVQTKIMSQQEAIDAGAMALFGEKYDEDVRVLSMGEGFSVELCGGTHVNRSGDIGLFVITSDSALAAGVRRIEALTGARAMEYLKGKERLLNDACELLKINHDDLPTRIGKLMLERKDFEKEIKSLQQKLATSQDTTAPPIKEVAGIKFMGRIVENLPPKELKSFVDMSKKHLKSDGIVALISLNEGKASIVVGVTDNLTDKISAVDLVRAASIELGGKGGGGRSDLAQAGGSLGNQDAAHKAIEAIEGLMESSIK